MKELYFKNTRKLAYLFILQINAYCFLGVRLINIIMLKLTCFGNKNK